MRCSRRHALHLLGASGLVTATAGCLSLSPGSLDDYALVATELDFPPVEPPYLWPDPTAVRATTRVDFTAETKRRWVAELFDTGRVTVQQWPLVGRSQWGSETRPRPTFLRRGGAFHRVRVAEERNLDRERWHLAVERTDETPPADATVERSAVDLSAQDERVLDAALDAVYAGNDGFLGDPEFDGLRTVEYHRGLDAGASDLVPSPPFEFVQVRDEYFRVVTERRAVQVPEWSYTVEEVASTRDAFAEYARSAVVDYDLRSAGLSTSARGVLDDALGDDPPRYEEGAPPSDDLTEVLRALGIAGDLRSVDAYDDRTEFENVVTTYRDGVYRFTLIVTP